MKYVYESTYSLVDQEETHNILAIAEIVINLVIFLGHEKITETLHFELCNFIVVVIRSTCSVMVLVPSN